MIHVKWKYGENDFISMKITSNNFFSIAYTSSTTEIANSQTRFSIQITLLNCKANIQLASICNSTMPKQVAKTLDKRQLIFRLL